MKIFFVFAIGVFLLINCKDHEETETSKNAAKISNNRIDSLKWLFYAYSYSGKAIFFDGQRSYSFDPIQCEIKIDTTFVIGQDSLETIMSLSKENYRYSHIDEGFDLHGFTYYNNSLKPITGVSRVDSFENADYLGKFNKKIDSAFGIMLKSCDSSKMSKWLLTEAKKRGVF